MRTSSPSSSSACMVIVISSDTPLPRYTWSGSTCGNPGSCSYRDTTARRADRMPRLSLYPWACGTDAIMSRTI